MVRATSSPRVAIVLSGAAAVIAARGLLGFSAQLLIAAGASSGDWLVRILAGGGLQPWNLRSLLWAIVVGGACAVFLPPLARGLASRDVPSWHAAAVGGAAALVELAAIDLVQHDAARLGSTTWGIALVVALPLAGGLLAALVAR